jgi:hypothetical protein
MVRPLRCANRQDETARDNKRRAKLRKVDLPVIAANVYSLIIGEEKVNTLRLEI